MTVEDSIRQLLPRAREVMNQLSADQLNQRPAENSWSVAECIAHLNTTNAQYVNAILASITQASKQGWTTDRQRSLGWFERWFVKSLEPPYKMKFKAPAAFRPEGSRFDKDELLATWTSTHERLAVLARDAAGLDMRRAKVPSPATPLMRISLLCAFHVTCAHDRRHLWQAQRVRERIG